MGRMLSAEVHDSTHFCVARLQRVPDPPSIPDPMTAEDLESYHYHEPDPFLIQFTEYFGIRYYGLAYILGFLIGAWLLYRYHKKGLSPFDPQQQQDIFLYLIIGVAVGGRLGYFIFYQPLALVREPLSFFKVWDGGMASHGGFIGIAIAIWYIARKYQQPFWRVADLVSSLAPPGLMFGRIANYINGELWGKVATVPWAVRFSTAPDGGQLPRHPSQLYEAALEGLLLLIYTQCRIWLTPVLKEKPGQLAGEFLLGYAIARIVAEQFREPDAALTFGLFSRGTTLSFFLALAGAAIIWRANRQATPSKT